MEKYSYLLKLPKQLAISIISKLPTEELREALNELEQKEEKGNLNTTTSVKICFKLYMGHHR